MDYRVRIRAKLYTSDHSGYCSGDECDLDVSEVDILVDVPECHLDEARTTGKVPLHPKRVWKDLLPEPELEDLRKSGYCEVSERARAKGLGHHDYKYKIKQVTLQTLQVQLPQEAPAECVAAWKEGNLTTPQALELIGWASKKGNVEVLRCVQNNIKLSKNDVRCVIDCLKTAACSGYIDVFEFWEREYALTGKEVCSGSVYPPLAFAALHDQVGLLKWLQKKFKLGPKDVEVLKLEALGEITSRQVMKCLREDFGVTDDDIKDVIHTRVNDLATNDQTMNIDWLDLMLDTLTQTWTGIAE